MCENPSLMRRWLFGLGSLGTIALLVGACTSGDALDASAQEDELRTDGGDGGKDGDAPDAVDGDAAIGVGAATITDARDGKVYPLVTIGGKTWLAKNLDWATASSWCWGDDPRSCARDGRLYTFAAARTACPKGFHLGTDDEWKALETALGMSAVDANKEGYTTVRGRDEGTMLKAAAGFNAAHGAGFRTGASYDARDDRTYYWTASTRGADVWRRRIVEAEPTVYRFTNPPDGFAISVRCAKD